MWGRTSPTKEIMLQSAASGDIGLIQSLLALDPTVLESKNIYGLTTLQLAIVHRHFRLAEYLVHAGIDVTLRDNFGWTALHDASLYSSNTLVEILLQYGSNILAKNQKGELPIDVAGDVVMETLLCEKMDELGHVGLARKYREMYGISLNDDSNDVFESFKVCPSQGIAGTRKDLDASRQGWDREMGSYYSLGVVNNVQGVMNTPGGVVNNDNYSLDKLEESNLRDHAHFNEFVNKPHTSQPPSRSSSPTKRYKSSLSTLEEKSEVFLYDTTSSATISNIHSSPKKVTSPVLPRRKTSVLSFELDRTSPMQPSSSISRSASFCTSYSSSTTTPRNNSLVAPFHSYRELNRSASDTDMRLTPEEMRRQQASGKRSSYPPLSSMDRETPIDLLKMRPRKPSIVDSARRRSRETGEETAATSTGGSGSRRSVSFQPEVLLQEVVTEGDADKVKEIISSGLVDLNKMSPVGLTALHQSALDGNLECAKTLVLNGADVNSIDVDGWSPLHAAAANGHLDVVRFFLIAGANPNAKDELGHTPYNVAKKGNVRKMLFRAASGKTLEPLEDDESDGEFSSEEEDYSHMESDSEDGELCFSDDSESSSPLMVSNRLEILRSMKNLRQLHKDSTDSVFSSELQDPALLTASLLKERELSDSTSSYGSMTDQDLLTSSRHDIAEFESASEAGSIGTLMNDDEEEEGFTDTDRETDQGFSTMDHLSSDSSHRRVACSDDEGTSRDVLDTNLISGSLDYKYQEAILNGDVDALLKLVKSRNEIEVDRVNKTSGISALHHSVLEENYTLVKHLVSDFKCDVNLKDVEGWTPLHAASAVGSIRIAQFLLENGAKASILNNNCEFPVDVTDEERMSAVLKKAMLGPPVGKMFKGILR